MIGWCDQINQSAARLRGKRNSAWKPRHLPTESTSRLGKAARKPEFTGSGKPRRSITALADAQTFDDSAFRDPWILTTRHED